MCASMLKPLVEAAQGLKSLLVGLKITGKEFAKPQRTVHYPRQVVGAEALKGFRGHIELVPLEDDPHSARCIACLQCERICPSNCILIKVDKPAKPAKPVAEETVDMDAVTPKVKAEAAMPKDGGRKKLASFQLDYTLCSLCGLCVQVCPVTSLRHSENLYLAGATREEFVFDLLARLRRQSEPPQPGEGPRGGGKPEKLAPRKPFVKKDAQGGEGA
ncbi:4Fe-4S binding protein [Megalodesulfovibrio paquesii]